MLKTAIIMGSDSDLPIMEKAIATLDEFAAPRDVFVMSAHRTPEDVAEFSKNAQQNGYGVIIAAAGKAAHLAGAIAANTVLPIIAVPVGSQMLCGNDALYSSVMMPSGIPVATVAIDGAVNAALLAIEILAVSDSELRTKLLEKRQSDKEKVRLKNQAVSKKYNNR